VGNKAKNALLTSCALAALSGFSSPCPAQQNPSAGNAIEEIVVTANKREESLNNVGLTVTAISKLALQERDITSLQDVAAAIPGLAFALSADNTPILTLRGIGFNESSLGVYPAVSVYVDQAPLPFPVLASHSAYDLQRIEVLKGPQGTLFGQNSTGGAINYIAAKPTKAFEAGGDIGYGRFNRIEGNAHLSGPVIDTVRARLAMTGLNSDGWQASNTRPYDINGKQSYIGGRLLVDWDPSDIVHFSLNLNGWQDTSQPQAGQLILVSPQTTATVQPQELRYPLSPQTPRAADWSIGDITPRSNRGFYQAALRADIQLNDDLNLTSLTSYDHFSQTQATDGDGSALVVTDLSRDDGSIRSFNQELRLANSTQSTFRWIVGSNYENSETFEDQLLRYSDDSNSSAPLLFINRSEVANKQSITNYAFFGNAEYNILPELALKAGARYTNSSNQATICGFDAGDGRVNGLWNILGTVLGKVPFTPLVNTTPADSRCYPLNQKLVPGGHPFTSTLQEQNASWRAGLDYHVDQSTLLYLNVSRGYKAGSFPVLAAATASQYEPVTQESVTAYEAGIKDSVWDRKVQLNAATFYYNYKNKQVLGKERDPVFGILDVLINVPESRVFGLEGEATVKPFPGMTLAGSATYLDSKIQRYTGINVLGNSHNFTGQPLPFTPEWNFGLNADYRMTLADGGMPFVGLSVDGHAASDTAIGGGETVIPAAPATRILPGLLHPFTMNMYATVDLRMGYESADGHWKLMLWGKNIFNEYYWTNVVTASDFSARYAGAPATYGITYSYDF
jgi:outer membrane receptor protein involved in Fe transport